ncbi:glyoxalase superfamily protein [Oricola sp.]|uniref:glyoxalase superfamily protein n=1 Tax=Oricola sp. TaxID=1979950 RepID=UPI0025CB78FB|nr:glyoxalase superfamily protein [Oricola sp.]MCI5076216.1 glyoxalase superfamily protein [Oricola sp.]
MPIIASDADERPRTPAEAKQRARVLRRDLSSRGIAISHSQALERVAAELGFRDWNTAVARLSNEPPFRIQLGDTVSGTYLKQPFTGRVLAVQELSGGSHYRVTLHFDEAVDVVSFESFSAFRQRVNATVDDRGVSPNRTSDGEPHLVLWPVHSAVS